MDFCKQLRQQSFIDKGIVDCWIEEFDRYFTLKKFGNKKKTMELFRIDSDNIGSLPIAKNVFKKAFDQWVKEDGAGQRYAD